MVADGLIRGLDLVVRPKYAGREQQTHRMGEKLDLVEIRSGLFPVTADTLLRRRRSGSQTKLFVLLFSARDAVHWRL